MLVGKSNTVGILEGECAGLRLRQVELFNKKHLYCKEMALAPFRGRAMRKGLPQHLHVQIFQADPLQELMDPGSLLPWKVGVLLLPKADFSTGFDLDVEKDSCCRPRVPNVAGRVAQCLFHFRPRCGCVRIPTGFCEMMCVAHDMRASTHMMFGDSLLCVHKISGLSPPLLNRKEKAKQVSSYL